MKEYEYDDDYDYERLKIKNDHRETYKEHILRLLERYEDK